MLIRILFSFIFSCLWFTSGEAQVILNEQDTTLMLKLGTSGVKEIRAYDYLHTNGKMPEKGVLKREIKFDTLGRIVEYTSFENDEILLKTIVKYQNGLVHSEILSRKQGHLQTTTYKYEDSLPTQIKTMGNSGTVRYLEKLEYNDHGNVSSQSITNHKGLSTTTKTQYRYNENGQVIQKSEMNEFNRPIQTRYFTYTPNGKLAKVSGLHTEAGKVPITEYTYDEKDRVIEKIMYSDGGELQTTHRFKYEDDKILSETILDHVNDTEYIIQREFDRKGRIKSELGKYPLDKKINYKFKVKYNCKGLEKKVIIYDKDGKVKKIEKKSYDKQGNLIERIFKNDSGTYRTIRYEIKYH